jgi:hypothetical protein
VGAGLFCLTGHTLSGNSAPHDYRMAKRPLTKRADCWDLSKKLGGRKAALNGREALLQARIWEFG